jgi:twinkle protein
MDYKIKNGQARFSYCPICNETNEKHEHFCVSLAKGAYYCHKTGSYGKVENLEPWFSNTYRPLIMDDEAIKPMDTHVTDEIDFLQILLDTQQKYQKADLQYFASRGIMSIASLQGYSCMNEAGVMMIPITDGENVIGIKYRQIYGHKKCWCKSGSQLTRLINWQHVDPTGQRVVIVEGEIDLASVLEAGYPWVVSLPNGASNLKAIEHMKSWLATANTVILAFDNDKAGKQATERAINMLAGTVDVAVVNLGENKDFNEMLVNEGVDAIKRAINSATKHIAEDEFFVEENCYWRRTKTGVKKMTSFWLDILGYSQHVIKCDVHYSQGLESQTVHIPRASISNKTEIAGILGGDIMCSATELAQLVNWLVDSAFDKGLQCQAIDYYGIHETQEGMQYYTPEDKVVCDRQDMVYATYNPYQYRAGQYSMPDDILKLRSDPIQSLLLLAWWAGRLYHLDDSYPILELVGTTSSGKSEIMEFMCRLGQGKYENICTFDNLTPHQIRSMAGCSNVTPFCIDEIKFTGKVAMQKASDLSGLIRSVYDNKPLRKGNLTQKLDVYYTKTPLILSGESRIEDSSVQNRMISAMLSKENKSEKGIFEKLKKTDTLERLGATLIKRRLQNPDLPRNYNLIADVSDDRQYYNISCVIDGMDAVAEFIEVSSVLRYQVVEFLKGAQKANIQLVTAIQWLIDLQETDDYQNQVEGYQWYICDAAEHKCRWTEMYKHLVELKNKTNSPMELLDAKAFKKMLKGEGLITSEGTLRTNGKPDKWVKMEILEEFCKNKNIIL